MTPVAINTLVATSERTDRRPKPQTPWPLVQPLPIRVPRPTSAPASGDEKKWGIGGFSGYGDTRCDVHEGCASNEADEK